MICGENWTYPLNLLRTLNSVEFFCSIGGHADSLEKLALTFNGDGKNVTVKPLDKSNVQVWHIADFDGRTQSISSQNAGNLQAAWGANVVTVIPAGNYVWTIRSSDAGYIIQDGGLIAYWGVTSINADAFASIGPNQALVTRRWVLESI